MEQKNKNNFRMLKIWHIMMERLVDEQKSGRINISRETMTEQQLKDEGTRFAELMIKGWKLIEQGQDQNEVINNTIKTFTATL